MTTTTNRRRTTNATGLIIPADRTPLIGELVSGTVIYRWATIRPSRLVSELPCHRDQMAILSYDPTAKAVLTDQPIVCRRCFATYAATPIPATDDFAWYRVVYRHTGHVTMSRPKLRSE